MSIVSEPVEFSASTSTFPETRTVKDLAILGMGTALPPYFIGQEESVRYAQEAFCRTDEQKRILPLLYRMSGVKKRYSALLEAPEGTENRQSFLPMPTGSEDRGPTIGARMNVYERESLPLAVRAATQALANSATVPKDITHLVTVSCSGFVAPGVDIRLIKDLGLRATVQRAHLGFMGCHGALNGLRVAHGFANTDPQARVLLCAVELCSIHYHYGWNPDFIVANALFADGAAALIAAPAKDGQDGAWQVHATGSCLLPDSEDAITWRIGDHGFVMSLSPRVPDLIATHLKAWLESWLSAHGLALSDIRSWAVHPGGPRILGAVNTALSLPKDALDVSKELLREHGNMSSPTVLFIINQLRQRGAQRPCVALAFGPGLMAEAALFV
ncbi:MAG: type III polyketide synthase [Candidatus Hydrogenedentes bacterium]|nr:type III polyketide synthase [Candidatus Hydrogenedentota bacterium]